MEAKDIALIASAAVLIAFAVYLCVAYSSMRSLHTRVQLAWQEVTPQLQNRAELVPGLLEVVRTAAAHEEKIFTALQNASEVSSAAEDAAAAAQAEPEMQQALKSLFTVTESYPQLQANQSFLDLQAELASVESQLQAARRFYNGGVREYNTKIYKFPNKILARAAGYKKYDFFDVENIAAIAQPPRINFG